MKIINVGKFILYLFIVFLLLLYKKTMAIISFQEIVLDNNQKFHYTVHPFEMKNSLGKVIALLQEYVITTSDTIPEPSYFKLYKTKEGYWYEIGQLKSAINSIETGFENKGRQN